MSKYKLGDYDYQIPGANNEALEWEIGRLTEEVIPRLKKRILQLEDVLRFTRDTGFNFSKINKVLDAD